MEEYGAYPLMRNRFAYKTYNLNGGKNHAEH